MKRLLAFIISIFSILSATYTQEITWGTGNGDPCASSSMAQGITGTTIPACITSVVDLCRGAGLNMATGADFNSNSFDSSNSSCNDAISDDDCYSWSYTVGSGCTFVPDKIDFELDVSGTGPTNYCLDMFVDGNIEENISGLTDTGAECITFDISGTIIDASSGDVTVEFRLCAWGASGSSGTMDIEEGSECAENGINLYQAVLPVDWGKVRAEKDGNDVKVSWSTYKETDNSKFEIEHSADGKDFRIFKEVIVNENSNSLKTYSVMHENAVNTNYYRVKQIDFNGTYSYSEVTHLALTRSSDVNVYPNPTTDKLYIEGIDLSHADIQVLDVMAKEIQAYDIDIQANALNMDRLSQGAYFVVIHSQDGSYQYKIYKH